MKKEFSKFYLLIAFISIFFLYLILTMRLVKGHDAFIHFSLQYYFFNHVVNFGNIPLWMPYMTHGSPSLWWFPIQAGFIQNIVLFTGGLFANLNFLYIYHLQMFIDEIILGAGTWLLARHLFKSQWTALFVSMTVVGSNIWMSQPWFNFHTFYCLPLILFLGHRFLSQKKWMYFFLSGNLLIFQFLGNLPYCVSIIALVVFIYFASYIACNKHVVKGIPWSKGWVSICALSLNAFLAYQMLSIGSSEIINYNYDRSIDSTLTYDVFMNYGGKPFVGRWLEMLWGVSPNIDYTLFIGIIPLALIVIALGHLKHRYLHVFLTTAILFLICQATIVAGALYYAWPLMKYFRHLALVAVFVKLFLCFLAGAGLHVILRNRLNRGWSIVTSCTLAAAAIYLFYLSVHYDTAIKIMDQITKSWIPLGRYEWNPTTNLDPVIQNVISPSMMGQRLGFSALLCVLCSLFVIFFKKDSSSRSLSGLRMTILIILGLQVIDIGYYKFQQIHIRTTPLIGPNQKLTEFTPMPYFIRRNELFDLSNPRANLLWDTVPFPGILHWSLNSFVFEDQVQHPYRTDYWLKPLDQLIRTLNNQPKDDLTQFPKGLTPYLDWKFPLNNPAAKQITGVSRDKIQFFSNGKSIPLRYKIHHFSADKIEIMVEPFDNKQGIWLYYADVWHPYWRATVNGKEVPVHKANYAYKTVHLKDNVNTVTFYFKNSILSGLYLLFALNALLWIIFMIKLLILV